MSLYEDVKHFIKRLYNRSDYLLKINNPNKRSGSSPLTIKHKFRLNAKEITTNQSVVDDIVKKIIKKDSSKRSFAGKKDKDIKSHHGRIYQYESYRTQNVKLIHSNKQSFNIYIGEKLLGELPDKYYREAIDCLETSVMMAFAYVTGGPFKELDSSINRVIEGFEPFDLTIYVQFA